MTTDNKQSVLTGDEIRAAVRDANNMSGPSDATQPAEYVWAGAQAVLSKLRGAEPVAWLYRGAKKPGYDSNFETHNVVIAGGKFSLPGYYRDNAGNPIEPEPLYAAPQASAEVRPLSQYGYQALFDAIAAATFTTASGDIEISVQAFRDALRSSPAAEDSAKGAGRVDEAEMSLRVALSFADCPRPYHTMQAPADTNGELYRALAVLAREYRAALPADRQQRGGSQRLERALAGAIKQARFWKGLVKAIWARDEQLGRDTREAFEAWAKSVGFILRTGPDGAYRSGYGAEPWLGWQARAALAAQPATRESYAERMADELADAIFDHFKTPAGSEGNESAWDHALAVIKAAQKPVEGDLTLRQQYEDACIFANANAGDAERLEWIAQNAWALRDLDNGRKNTLVWQQPRTATEGALDRLRAAIDAAIAQQGKEA